MKNTKKIKIKEEDDSEFPNIDQQMDIEENVYK